MTYTEHVDQMWFDEYNTPEKILAYKKLYENYMGKTHHMVIADMDAFIKNKDLWNEGDKLYEQHIKDVTGIQDYPKANKKYFKNLGVK